MHRWLVSPHGWQACFEGLCRDAHAVDYAGFVRLSYSQTFNPVPRDWKGLNLHVVSCLLLIQDAQPIRGHHSPLSAIAKWPSNGIARMRRPSIVLVPITSECPQHA